MGGISQAPTYLPSDTYANFLARIDSYPVGQRARATDGISGFDIIKVSSTRWLPAANTTGLFSMSSMYVGIAGSCTGTTNGAFTLSTAMPTAITKGWMYFEAGVLHASQSAGIYYVVMSNTSSGVAYQETYTPAAGVYPTIPASPTAWSGAVPGGAGSTNEVSLFISHAIPQSLLGADGAVDIDFFVEMTSNTNTKYARVKMGGTAFGVRTPMTSVTSFRGYCSIANRGAANAQRCRQDCGWGTSASTDSTGTVDTDASAPSVTITLQNNTATDTIGLTWARVCAGAPV